MKGLDIPYAIKFELIDKILDYLNKAGSKGKSIKEIFETINYNDATGKSMMIKFLLENHLIKKKENVPRKNIVTITFPGKEFIIGDLDGKKAIFRENLNDTLVKIVEMLYYNTDNDGYYQIDEILNILQKDKEMETKRVQTAKRRFIQKFLPHIGLAIFKKDPKPSLKITDSGKEWYAKFCINGGAVIEAEKVSEPEINLKEVKSKVIQENQKIETNSSKVSLKLPEEINETKNKKREPKEEVKVNELSEEIKWSVIEEVFNICYKNPEFSTELREILNEILDLIKDQKLPNTKTYIETMLDIIQDFPGKIEADIRKKYYERLKRTVKSEFHLFF
ncbi:MAG: hypothetical protein HWN65_03010 [Candidatus Helarchaeota archaeon]|nr:hypothetical protein [Candidatus Helarchaeota archaeon]